MKLLVIGKKFSRISETTRGIICKAKAQNQGREAVMMMIITIIIIIRTRRRRISMDSNPHICTVDNDGGHTIGYYPNF